MKKNKYRIIYKTITKYDSIGDYVVFTHYVQKCYKILGINFWITIKKFECMYADDIKFNKELAIELFDLLTEDLKEVIV